MTTALKISDLKKVYNNQFEALKGINLEVQQGDFFGLLGPNGAGKSTTIGIITALVNKTTGQVEVFGHDIEQDAMAARRCIGLVPQEFNFNQFEPVEEVVLNQAGYYGVPLKEARTRCEWALKSLGLWEKRRNMARRLSGGMKRRLMIARALIHKPKLLILDEPTAGVDIELRRSMWAFLQEVNAKGTTIILTTHYLEEAEQLCRNLAIIDQGKIIENANTKVLLNKLNKETFILDVKDGLAELPQLDCAYPAKLIDPHCLEIEVHHGQGLNPVFKELNDKGIEILSMRNKANRLEELFLDLVEGSGSSL